MQILKVLFIVILILFPFGELLRFSSGSNIYLKPLDIIVGITAVCWLWVYIQQVKISKRKLLPWYYLGFPLIGFISLVIHSSLLEGNEFFVSFLYLIRWLAYLSIIGVLKTFSSAYKITIQKFLFISGTVLLTFGYIQYFFYNDIRKLITIGWDDHLYRLFATFFDPNFAGAFFVLLFIYGLGIIFSKKENKLLPQMFILPMVTLTLLAIFLTYSRSALVMLIVSASIFLLLINRRKLLLILFGSIIIFIVTISPFFYLENINLFRTASTQARINVYTDVVQIIREHPLFGVGFNSFRYVQQNYGFRSETPKYPSNADAGTDNSWLFIIATTGIVGFTMYLSLWYQFLRTAFEVRKESMLAIVFIASSLGIFVNAFFINSLFFPIIMLWLWTLYGLLPHKNRV